MTVANGHELLTRTTASGCALTALIGAWVAVLADPLEATAGALAVYGVAAELAAAEARGCGTLRARPAGCPRRHGRRHRGAAGPHRMRRPFALDLYLVTDRRLCGDQGVERVVRQAVAGGVTMVQLRDDQTPSSELAALGRRLVEMLRPSGGAADRQQPPRRRRGRWRRGTSMSGRPMPRPPRLGAGWGRMRSSDGASPRRISSRRRRRMRSTIWG